MSREPKNNEEGFMYKLASFIVDKRNLIFLIVAIGLVFSVFSRNWVQVENQLSAYLPKDSETYKGLHLMEDEFITFGTAKVMLVNVTYDEAPGPYPSGWKRSTACRALRLTTRRSTIPTPPRSTTLPSTIPRRTRCARRS